LVCRKRVRRARRCHAVVPVGGNAQGAGASAPPEAARHVRRGELAVASLRITTISAARQQLASSVERATLHHQADAPQVRDVGERISIEYDEIRELAGFERTNLA